MDKYLLVVGGPTASGKTSLAIALARHFNTEIVSADSRQFYREMRIGNACPTTDELAAVPHHLIADRSLDDPLSAGAFAREAQTILDILFAQHDHVVLVGGSGLYIRALTEGLDEFPAVTPEVKERVQKLYITQGLAALQAAVAEADPVYYKEMDRQNPARLQRALEVSWSAGHPYSGFRKGKNQSPGFIPVYFQPTWPRDQLYDRINRRVLQMLEDGLEVEARTLIDRRALPALQTVGYQEWWPYFEEATPRDVVVAAIQQNSRRYAKRQLTWNRRDGYWKSVPQGNLKVALTYLHLVKTAGWFLTELPVAEQAARFHAREKRKVVSLQDQAARAASGQIQITSVKGWAFLNCEVSEIEYLAKVILLHEACYRAEAPLVYTIRTEQGYSEMELRTMGWEGVEEKDLPRLLSRETEEIWCWTSKDSNHEIDNKYSS